MGLFKVFRSIFGSSEPEPGPASDAQATPTSETDRRARLRRDARDGTRALIIDDSRTIVAALNKFLRSGGFVTLEALDAEVGLDLARSQRPGIIFLEIVLPGMNGFSALRLLRKDPLTRDIPVIMMSGNEQATEQFFGSRIGADDFMKKPFSRAEIFSRIEKLLDDNMVPRRRPLTMQPSGPAAQPVSAAH